MHPAPHKFRHHSCVNLIPVVVLWRPHYTVCVMVITGGQSSNKVEPSSVIVMLLSVYTHLTIGDPVTWYRVFGGEIDELYLGELTN